jgi:hypothetical protein
LYFKKTAYNWLTFCREKPPCYQGNKRVPHTKFGDLYFHDHDTLCTALLLCNGKLLFTYWLAVGDDFDVTKWNVSEFPADLSEITGQTQRDLLSLVPQLEQAMQSALQFKLNAGRRVGNYNLSKCRDVTDRSDRILAEALGFSEVWEDVELYYAQTVGTDYGLDVEEG